MPQAPKEEEAQVVPQVSSRVEKFGILGSVEKCRARVYRWQRLYASSEQSEAGKTGDEEAESHRKAEADKYEKLEADALRSAMRHYEAAFKVDMSVHWAGAQYLSLAVVTGLKPPPLEEYWSIVKAAAEIKTHDPDGVRRAWAYGSLLELALLDLRSEKRESRPVLSRRVDQLWARFCDEAGAHSPEWVSTIRQIRRYADWWEIGRTSKRAREVIEKANALE